MQRIDVEKNTILLCLTGSRLYGIDNADSDYDYKGICIPPVKYFFGTSSFEQFDGFKDEPQAKNCIYSLLTNTDSSIYNLKKYVQLALLNNPNILELLWVDPKHYLVKTKFADRLIALKEEFLSTKVYYSYAGYSFSQIKRVKTHRGWLLAYRNDPNFFDVAPNPKDYGLEENPLRKEQLNAFLEFLYVLLDDAAQYHEIKEDVFSKFDFKGWLKQRPIDKELLDQVQYYTRSTNDFMTLLHNTQRYKQAVQEYEAFHSWKKNRNSNRALIEERCGYDCYSDDTEFLTKDGWKLYSDIKDGEEIGTFNIDNQQLEFQIPIDRCSFASSDNLISISNRYTECLVTENHKLFVSKFIRKPSNNYSSEYKDSIFELTTYKNLKDFHVINSLKSSDINYEVDDNYLEIMAAYVTEGTINKRKNKTSIVNKALHIEQKEGNRLESWLDSMVDKNIFKKYSSEKINRNHNMPDYKGHIYVCTNHQIISKLITDCGEGSKHKKLPSWTMFLSQTQALKVIDIMMKADGTNKKMGRVLYTSSKELANTFQIMCVCAGIKCLVWEYLDIKGGFNIAHDIYQIYVPYDVNRFSVIRSCKSVKTIESPVKNVVCFTTTNQTLITRRNFKVAFHGNSKHMGHAYRLLKSGIEILEGKGVLPDRRDIDADYIRDIRNGNVNYESIINEVEGLLIKLEDAKTNTKLPKYPNTKLVEDEMVSLLRDYLL